MSNTTLIETQEELNRLVNNLKKEDVIALDTEFHGEKRYWPELFLIQFAGMNGPVAVDPLGIEDLSPIGELLESKVPVKVIHSARNDIDILMHHLGIVFSSVFDTQLAAAFLGYEPQISLYNLIRSECGKAPQKGHTLSDWSIRPLSREQLQYALNDVRYLHSIYENQMKRLKSTGRLNWYTEQAESLTSPSTYEIPLQKIFQRVRSTGKITKSRLPILWALVQWREKIAEELNKPRKYIVKDHILGAITAMAPEKISNLSSLRGISSGFVNRWGKEMLSVIREAGINPPENIPDIPKYHNKPGISARRDILRIFLKQESNRLGISPSLLLSSDMLDALAKHPPGSERELSSIPGLSGWRSEALGDDLISLLDGKLALSLKPGRSPGLRFVKVEQ
ncbi:MAG: ribonuclease D [Candidatus Fermentibacteraceae bacterium]|nr:ribonuclease D [Candidatus Fermentibacteraceae bacterium]